MSHEIMEYKNLENMSLFCQQIIKMVKDGNSVLITPLITDTWANNYIVPSNIHAGMNKNINQSFTNTGINTNSGLTTNEIILIVILFVITFLIGIYIGKRTSKNGKKQKRDELKEMSTSAESEPEASCRENFQELVKNYYPTYTQSTLPMIKDKELSDAGSNLESTSESRKPQFNDLSIDSNKITFESRKGSLYIEKQDKSSSTDSSPGLKGADLDPLKISPKLDISNKEIIFQNIPQIIKYRSESNPNENQIKSENEGFDFENWFNNQNVLNRSTSEKVEFERNGTQMKIVTEKITENIIELDENSEFQKIPENTKISMEKKGNVFTKKIETATALENKENLLKQANSNGSSKSQEIVTSLCKETIIEEKNKSPLFVKHNQTHLFETGRFKRMFTDIKPIGAGGFGRVFEAKHNIEKTKYAIKQIFLPLKKNQDIQEHKYFREVNYLLQLNHKNVIRHFTTWIEEPDDCFLNEYEKRLNKERKKKEKTRKKALQAIKDDDESSMKYEESLHTNLSEVGFEWEVESIKNDIISNRKSVNTRTKHYEVYDPSQSNMSDSFSKVTQDQSLYKEIIDKIIHLYDTETVPVILNIQSSLYEGKTFKEYLENRDRKINTVENFELFKQMIDGVQYIHDKGIIHRDIKPSNIFLDKNLNVFIGDFGLSTLFQENNDNSMGTYTTSEEKSISITINDKVTLTKDVGTPLYIAPEVEKNLSYDHRVDVYSMGLILFEMFLKITTAHEKQDLFRDLKVKRKLPTFMEQKYPDECRLILLLTANERPLISELLASKEYKSWECKVKNQTSIN